MSISYGYLLKCVFFPTFTVVYILENKKIKEAKKWDI